ncbi:DEAD/DEAH box helicase family protein [Streptomyces sp. NPDC057705]|uniref:DEAD/DEAH box helicase family protein n=1 Tax=Streptomyces sp. NPDC057705 TaxID=3346222 RepID=UPI003676A0A3
MPQAVVRHLHRPGNRGLYVAATGTGKTVVGIRATLALRARLVLVVVPTLDLAAQTALAWRADGYTRHLTIVSSMDTAGHGALTAAQVGSTGDPAALAALLSVVGPGPDQIPFLTVVCTYDSLDKIRDAQHTGRPVPPFDLAIMDEAHRIAGRPDKKWTVINDAAAIRADRRLYMTRTAMDTALGAILTGFRTGARTGAADSPTMAVMLCTPGCPRCPHGQGAMSRQSLRPREWDDSTCTVCRALRCTEWLASRRAIGWGWFGSVLRGIEDG